MSTRPSVAALTTTTRMPAITAEAALVPCAEAGIRQTSRAVVAVRDVVARGSRAARRARPASPAFGWIETRS